MTIPIYTYLERRTQNFLTKAKEVHNNKYDYSNVEYEGSKNVVNITCPEHGSFPQTPKGHLTGRGCPDCGIISSIENRKSSALEFIEKSNIVHNNFYDYAKVTYNDSQHVVNITCPEHGSFPQTPNNHLAGKCCPQCSKGNYSKIAINWLNSISPNIQHAENGGEYRIPNTKYRVDGYDLETNIVYEFHGDKFHGNPSLFSPDEICHPFDKNITAKELYQKTINRENEIKSLGYNLVVMWESEYNNWI